MGAVYSFLSKKQRALDTFDDIADDVMQHWRFYSNQNKLNEFIRSKFPEFIMPEPHINLLEDLNALSIIEDRLRFYPQISRIIMEDKSIKWKAEFTQDDITYQTGLFETEAIARIVNVLNFLCYNYQLSMTS